MWDGRKERERGTQTLTHENFTHHPSMTMGFKPEEEEETTPFSHLVISKKKTKIILLRSHTLHLLYYTIFLFIVIKMILQASK